VLAHEGAPALSPASVARRAGVDKALVYRYFGSFDGLLKAYVEGSLSWPTLADVAGDADALLALPFGARCALIMRRYAAALRARPDTVAILAAELLERTPFHAALEQRREQFGAALFQLAKDAPPGVDVEALATLMTGAIHYLLIRARQVEVFNGIHLASDAGWSRIESALDAALSGALTRAPASARRPRARAVKSAGPAD